MFRYYQTYSNIMYIIVYHCISMYIPCAMFFAYLHIFHISPSKRFLKTLMTPKKSQKHHISLGCICCTVLHRCSVCSVCSASSQENQRNPEACIDASRLSNKPRIIWAVFACLFHLFHSEIIVNVCEQWRNPHRDILFKTMKTVGRCWQHLFGRVWAPDIKFPGTTGSQEVFKHLVLLQHISSLHEIQKLHKIQTAGHLLNLNNAAKRCK